MRANGQCPGHKQRAHIVHPFWRTGIPASSSVYEVTVKDGKTSIGGGKFDLPRIKVADFVLGLRGSIETNDNGVQIITAGGSFTVPGLAAPTGCSGIEVDVTLEQDDSGGILMTLPPPPASLVEVRPSGPYLVKSADKVKLSEAQLKLNCAIRSAPRALNFRASVAR